MKATEQFLPVVLYIILYKVVLTFESVDEMLLGSTLFWLNLSLNSSMGPLPICPCAPFLTAACFCLIDSLIRSTSFWYRARSLCAPSLASFRACSNDFTRSCVARRRFSSFGSSHLRSALSLTSCE